MFFNIDYQPMFPFPNYNQNHNQLFTSDPYLEEMENKIRNRDYYIDPKKSYCGQFYNNQEGYENKLLELGIKDPIHKTPYCPIRIVSKEYALHNLPRLVDIPRDMFNNYIDNYLDRGKNLSNNFTRKLASIDDANNLSTAFHKYRTNGNGVQHKKSVKKYRANQLQNELIIKKNMENGTLKLDKPYEFTLNERGHIRYIKAPSVKDQVIQRSMNDNLLFPYIKDHIIYDNCASLKNKGLSLQRKRFKIHLQNAYKEFGPDAYILQTDFSKYFDNIDHQNALQKFSKFLTIDEFKFITQCFEQFEIDMSYMDEDEFLIAQTTIFNNLLYNEYIYNNGIVDKLTKDKILKRSLGIGNQLSQSTGVFFPTEIDNYIKIVKGYKYYGRYMDDSYLIVRTKEEAKQILEDIDKIAKRLGIFINKNKTRINKIHKPISFLKIIYTILPSERIIEKPVSETFRRERRRLRKFKNLLGQNRLTLDHIKECYRCWRGTYYKLDCKSELFKLDKYFEELFNISYKD